MTRPGLRRPIAFLPVILAMGGCAAASSQSDAGVGVDAASPDADSARPDASSLSAPTEDGGPDAQADGSEAPPGLDAAACDTLGCTCDILCEKVVEANCAGERRGGEYQLTLAECRAECRKPLATCRAEHLAATQCKAELPQEAFICNEVFQTYDTQGCEPQERDYMACDPGSESP